MVRRAESRLSATVIPRVSARRLLAIAAAGTFIVGAATLWWTRQPAASSIKHAAGTLSPSPSGTHSRAGNAAETPEIEVTKEGQLARVRHKNAAGLSPLEKVVTPDGVVTIQRTFNQAGTLLKEEAFLNGHAVPVPGR
jgi:hypothetical protein